MTKTRLQINNDRYFDLVVQGGKIVTPAGIIEASIGVRQGRIMALGTIDPDRALHRIEAQGLHILPGIIDSQVHFREPGLMHKEDLESGTKAAVLGGVTTIFDMPNTSPPLLDAAGLADKLHRAAGRCHCDHAFFMGAAAENAEQLAALENLPGCCGVKIFMGSSTGTLLVSEDTVLKRVLASGRRRVAVHCEDETRLRERRALVEDQAAAGKAEYHPVWRDAQTALRATQKLLTLARQVGRLVHVLHVTTEQEMQLLPEYRDLATVEVTPQHLTLTAPECYERLGTLAQMNPPIRDGAACEALWAAVAAGLVDVIGSDHAPHTLAEKTENLYPNTPSGMPGVQTLLPIMLTHLAAGRLSLFRVVDLLSAGPARVYGIARKGRIALGYDADFTLVDLQHQTVITQDWLASRSGWSPFLGMKVTGWPIATILRGTEIMRDGEILSEPIGCPVQFHETLHSEAVSGGFRY